MTKIEELRVLVEGAKEDDLLQVLDELVFAARCALADLIGSWQAQTRMDPGSHDWKGHLATINELSDILEDPSSADVINQECGYGY